MWWLTGTAFAMDLSYEECLQRALERNPALVQAGLDLEGAEGALLAARGTFDPQFTGHVDRVESVSESVREFGEVYAEFQAWNSNAGLSRFFSTGTTASLDWQTTRQRFVYELPSTGVTFEDDAQTSTELSAQIRQNLLQGHRTTFNLAGVRTAQSSRDQAQLALASQRLQTLADAANAYWNLVYVMQLADISKASLEVAKEEQRIVHARVEAGDLAPVERSRVDAAVVQAEAAQIAANNNAAAAGDALLIVLGENPGETIHLTTPPANPATIKTPTLEATIEQADVNSPVLAMARLSQETADLERMNARHARLPDLDATGRYALKGFEDSLGAAMSESLAGDLPEWFVGVDLNVPLGNRADRGSFLQKQAAVERTRIETEAVQRSIEQQLRAQLRSLEAAQQNVVLADANLRLAEETLAAERALQDAGRAIQKDVLESIRVLDDARVQQAKAQADVQLALIELERIKGTL